MTTIWLSVVLMPIGMLVLVYGMAWIERHLIEDEVVAEGEPRQGARMVHLRR